MWHSGARQHPERILGYALRRTPSGEDAHDIVSDTFLTAWRRLDDVPDVSRRAYGHSQ